MDALPLSSYSAPSRLPPKRRAAQVEKDLRNEEKLLSHWRRLRREKLQALLDGPHGREVRDLVGFLNRMRLSSAPALIEQVEQATWIQRLSENNRHDLLQVINTRTTRLRLRNGLPPFDDALPGEPPKAFEQIKEIIGVR